MSNLVSSPDVVDLRIADEIQAIGGLADFRLLRFAAGVQDFSTGEAARAIQQESQPALDRRAESLLGAMLTRAGQGRPKRYAATRQARAAITAIQSLASGSRLGQVPFRLVGARPTAAVAQDVVARILDRAEEIYDADGAFAMVAVFGDEPQLVRDLVYRLHMAGVEAEEIRLAGRRL